MNIEVGTQVKGNWGAMQIPWCGEVVEVGEQLPEGVRCTVRWGDGSLDIRVVRPSVGRGSPIGVYVDSVQIRMPGGV
jgi:hypothetical protein